MGRLCGQRMIISRARRLRLGELATFSCHQRKQPARREREPRHRRSVARRRGLRDAQPLRPEAGQYRRPRSGHRPVVWSLTHRYSGAGQRLRPACRFWRGKTRGCTPFLQSNPRAAQTPCSTAEKLCARLPRLPDSGQPDTATRRHRRACRWHRARPVPASGPRYGKR